MQQVQKAEERLVRLRDLILLPEIATKPVCVTLTPQIPTGCSESPSSVSD
jgi:hypothetical protein